MSETSLHYVDGPACRIAVHDRGSPSATCVLMTHSILSSSTMWRAQAELLAFRGWRVLCLDARGHGASDAAPGPYRMDDLVADSVCVMDTLRIARAHYVGLSLGGMSGFGLALQHPERLLSLCLCDARADMPPPLAGVWDERVALARVGGCAALANQTVTRWFGGAFVERCPDVARAFEKTAGTTSVEGFAGCAHAIQHLNYLQGLEDIALPTTLVVGANDGLLPQAMRELHARIPLARMEVIPDAGHLPNIDQPEAFNAVLLHHFSSLH